MKISVILLDWGIRESFHSIDYLNDQNATRSDYELIWIEYFDRKVPALEKYYQTGYLDKYLILGNDRGDYNKHKAWNIGVMEASGNVVVLCDSDVMFRKSFFQSIIDFFASHNNSFLLIDEIRSENKQFWPFNFPAWEEVLTAPGVVNWNMKYSTTNGLAPKYDNLPLGEKMFLRNYGACLCVKKSDYIRFGGLDEHGSYEGYICGPYDLAIRMVNGGMDERWHFKEFLLHTYHPWINPGIDKMGPHFRHNSTTSFKHMLDGNTMPYQGNKEIRILRREMYPEPPREGSPKFSIIIPDSWPQFVQRLYDSVKTAAGFPFEVIFIGKTACQADEPYMTCLQSSGTLYRRIIEGCQKAKGEIIAVLPGEAVFRPNTLDKLLDLRQNLIYPVVYLNAIETFNQGFIWQYASNKFTCNGQVGMMTAFDRNLLSEDLTESDLRRIFSRGKKIRSFFETPVHIEIWHDDAPIYDEYLQQLLTKMLDLQYAVLYTGMDKDADEAASLFNQIYALEKNRPGNFLKYCFLKQYSLREYYSFINLLGKFNRIDLTIKGWELLTESSALLLTNINENIKELIWLNKLIYAETAYFIGSAFFNTGVYELNHGNRQKAIVNFESCLNFIPNQKEVKKILAQIL
ncbi:MAG: glycosyltransferase [Syntrophomonas sp.]